eukprot:9214345-Pyramimonas_sp.AAC.1
MHRRCIGDVSAMRRDSPTASAPIPSRRPLWILGPWIGAGLPVLAREARPGRRIGTSMGGPPPIPEVTADP